jgi:DNA replication protein DnaC
MLNATLPVLLKELKLATVRQHWEGMEKEAVAQNWHHSHYLSVLCEHEVNHRYTSRIKRYLKESKLTVGKTLDAFDFTHTKSLNKSQVIALCEQPQWVSQAENVLIFGPSGVGKTHLAQAIGHSLVQQGERVLFTQATTLIQNLQAARKVYALPQALQKLEKYNVLIVDDVGYLQQEEAKGGILFELIQERYETKSLIITSNQPFSEWDKLFGDSSLTVAAIDRLVHHAHIIEISAESFRKKQLENRTGALPLEEEKRKEKTN